ncbi:hypothetical protein BJX76DRAFT_343232 [Aspergillus varians]
MVTTQPRQASSTLIPSANDRAHSSSMLLTPVTTTFIVTSGTGLAGEDSRWNGSGVFEPGPANDVENLHLNTAVITAAFTLILWTCVLLDLCL